MPKDFSRDLGYLDKFLMALRAHAETLGDAEASRLKALLDAQDRSWAEIRGLLGGEKAAAPASSASVEAPKEEAPPVAAREAVREALPKRLTVGSLISKS